MWPVELFLIGLSLVNRLTLTHSSDFCITLRTLFHQLRISSPAPVLAASLRLLFALIKLLAVLSRRTTVMLL